jgi:hypothetical protein
MNNDTFIGWVQYKGIWGKAYVPIRHFDDVNQVYVVWNEQ